jgi:flagellar basal-body rod protein FlgF
LAIELEHTLGEEHSMDRMIYTAMTGAHQVLEQQATVSNNLANASTTGFRAQIDSFRAVPVSGTAQATRTQVQDATVAADFTPGPVQQTGRDLDLAIQGAGWFSVQGANGKEAYTRSGALKVSSNGILQTQNGLTVLGEGGPLTVPPDSSLLVGKDGTLSTRVPGSASAEIAVLGRLKLVNPPVQDLVRGDDGLFRQTNGRTADADPLVSVIGGALEGSNVNVIDAMVRMISLGRQFDMHMNLLKNAENNAGKASQILALN